MNRVFRGALFPILIVIVLAFFVAKLVSPPSSSGVLHNYQSFTTKDLPSGNVKSFTADTNSNSINVTLKDNTRYSVGYDPGTAMLTQVIAQAKAASAEFVVGSDLTIDVGQRPQMGRK